MECTDLMLDDWVIDTYTGKPMRVSCVNIKVGKGLDPIPITPEILEKNGFEDGLKDDNVLVYEDENIIIEYYPKATNYTRGSYDYICIERGCISLTEMPIEYVHELQHALRLCRIDKEIVV